jgi:hypothetical protein
MHIKFTKQIFELNETPISGNHNCKFGAFNLFSIYGLCLTHSNNINFIGLWTL